MIKDNMFIKFGCAIIVLLLCDSFAESASNSWVSKGIVAIVNEEPITQQQLEDEIGEQISQLGSNAEITDAVFEEVKKRSLDNLIEHRLLTQYFSEQNGKVLKIELDNHLKEVESRNFHGSRELFTKYLISKGKTFFSFKKEVERSLIIGAMMTQKSKKPMSVSMSKIQAYYNSHAEDFVVPSSIKLHQIIFNNASLLQNTDLQKLDFAKKALGEGTSFDELFDKLDEYKTEPSWYLMSELNKDILERVKNAKIGEITPPVIVDNKCFISKIVERTEERIKSLSEVQNEVEKKCIELENLDAYSSWLADLKSKAYIKTR